MVEIKESKLKMANILVRGPGAPGGSDCGVKKYLNIFQEVFWNFFYIFCAKYAK